MEKSFYHDLIGVPFKTNGRDLNGLDCYGLILEMSNRLGKYLPEMNTPEGFELRLAMFEKLSSEYGEFIDKPESWAVVVFAPSISSRLHCGMVLLNCQQFIHTDKHGVRISRLDSRLWERRILGFYRIKNKDG